MQCDLTGAQILRPGGLVPDVVSLSDGVFVETPQNRRINLSGYWVLPGIIDLHGDGFERHLAPRRGAVRNLGAGLVATEAELAANGITTAVVSQFDMPFRPLSGLNRQDRRPDPKLLHHQASRLRRRKQPP